MNKSHLRILPILVLLLLATAVWAAAPKGGAESWDERAKRLKADAMLLETTSAMSADQLDQYFLLTRRAFLLDSTDLDNVYAWNTLMMNLTNDSATVEKGFQSFKERFFSDPSNYELGFTFARTAKRLGKYDDYLRTWEMLDSAFPSMSQPSEELADAYMLKSLLGDSSAYEKAMAIFKRLEIAQGRNIGLASQKIRALATRGDTLAILAEVDSLLAHAPKDPFVALFAGSNYQYLGDLDKALEYFSHACNLDSTIGAAYMSKAGVYQAKGDSAGYDREVFHALQSQNLDVEPKLEILTRYVSSLYKDPSQEKRIRRTFTDLEQMHSGVPQIHELYSSYLYEIKDYPGAAEEMSFAIALDPSEEGKWVNLVQLSALTTDTTQLLNRAQQAMERFPSNLYFPMVIASTWQARTDYQKALDVLNEVNLDSIKDTPFAAIANVVSYKGDLLSLMGDTLGALDKYNEALEIDPDNHLALNNAAYFMAEHDIDLDKAEQYSVKAVRDNPDNPTYLDTYAWVLFKKKDYSLAKQYIDMTINLYNTFEAEEQKAKEEAENAETTDDYILVEEAAAEKPSPEIFDHAGDIYFFNREPEKALEFWKKALELDPNNKSIGLKVKHKTYFYNKQ